MFKIKGVPGSVVVLGFVSFFTDVSSDMIYPLLPVFLTGYLGAGQWFIGLVEGVAEATAALFTLVAGVWADRSKDRSKLVLGGYSLSSVARPLVALAWSPWVVFFTRFFDRMGKGIRTSPRDALIADSVSAEYRGRAYGLQRSLDHTGAICGPILAALLLANWVTDLRVLFALAAIPGAVAVALIVWKVREVKVRDAERSVLRVSFKMPGGRLRIYFAIYFVFLLSCSSDAFLLLRCGELGIPQALLPIVWMVFNMMKAGTTLPFGALSDRVGRRRVMLAGWVVYACVYAGWAFARSPEHGWILFTLYGLFYGLTEGTERAMLVDYADPHERGRVFGWHYLIVGSGSLAASLLFGALWQAFGSKTAFLTSTAVSGVSCVFLYIFMKRYPASVRHSVEIH